MNYLVENLICFNQSIHGEDPKLSFIIGCCIDSLRDYQYTNFNLEILVDKLRKENEMLQAVVDGIQSREVKKL